tara:strand:+ start:3081 stop:3434 length:354 start_codon:yes stop_codon:yes gene_type:complete
MALIETQSITDAGKEQVLSSIGSVTNTFACTGKEFIAVRNATAEASVTVTVTAQVSDVESQVYGSLTKSDATCTVTAGSTFFIGPFPVGGFAQADGTASFTLSTTTDVTVGVFSCVY